LNKTDIQNKISAGLTNKFLFYPGLIPGRKFSRVLGITWGAQKNTENHDIQKYQGFFDDYHSALKKPV
jgi:hypothetical protein